MLKLFGLLFVLSGIFYPAASDALPNPSVALDISGFKEAGTDIAKVRDLRAKLYRQYVDKYFEIYAKEKNIDLVYTQLTFLKKHIVVRLEREKNVQRLIPNSVEHLIERFKKNTDEDVEEFESSGRLLAAQKQTANDALLKSLSVKIENSEKLDQELMEKLSQIETRLKSSLKTSVINESLEDKASIIEARIKNYEIIIFGFIGFSLINVILTVFFYRQSL